MKNLLVVGMVMMFTASFTFAAGTTASNSNGTLYCVDGGDYKGECGSGGVNCNGAAGTCTYGMAGGGQGSGKTKFVRKRRLKEASQKKSNR